MVWLYRFLLIVSLGAIGFVVGTIIGVPLVPVDSGLAGPAIAMTYGLLGTVFSVLIAILLCWWLSRPRLKVTALIFTFIALAGYVILPYLIITEEKVRFERQDEPPAPQSPAPKAE